MEEKIVLGEPTFLALGGDRFRCVETGHELLESEKERYASSRKCREALFDRALAEARSPLNFFQQSPDKRDRIVCKLTGAVVNKSEKAVWTHILGKSFSSKLSLKEKGGETASSIDEKDDNKDDKGAKVQATSVAKPKRQTYTPESFEEGDILDVMETIFHEEGEDEDSMEEGEPPRKEKKKGKKKKKKSAKKKPVNEDEQAEGEDSEMRVKRSAVAVGPSSFASRKKKRKTSKQDVSN